MLFPLFAARRVPIAVAIFSATLALSSCSRGSHDKSPSGDPAPQEEQKPNEKPKAKKIPKKQASKPRVTAPLTIYPTKPSIQKNFVDQVCISCHRIGVEGNRYVDLIDIGLLAEEGHVHEQGGPRHNLIKAGCPTQSFFLSIIKEGKMPPPPVAHPTQKTIKAIEDWIVSLNPGASCDNDEPGGGNDGGDDEPGGGDEPS